MADYLIIALTSAGLSLILNYFLIKLANRYNWLDYGQQQRPQDIHSQPTPRLGGVSIFTSLIISLIIFQPSLFQSTIFLKILISLTLIIIVGILDDLYNLNPYLRLATNTISALIIVSAGIKIEYITNPWAGGVFDFRSLNIPYFSQTISILWLVWLTNIISWSKGVDGQYPGLISLGLLAVAGLSLRFIGDPQAKLTFLLGLIASASFIGLLFYNIQPQKIMPGYSAGSLGGFLLGIISIMSGAKLATLFIVMGIPILDGIYAIIRRLSQGRSPVWGDNQHLHHLLLFKLKWTKKQIALFYWSITFILALVGLSLRSSQKMFTIVLVTILFISLIIWLKHFFTTLKQPGQFNGLKT